MYQPLDAAAKAIALRPGQPQPMPFKRPKAKAEPSKLSTAATAGLEAQCIILTKQGPSPSEEAPLNEGAAQTANPEGNSEGNPEENTDASPEISKTDRAGIDFSQSHWTNLAIGGLLLSLPVGVSAAAYHVIATPPQPNCNQPQRLRSDLAELQCLRRAMQSEDNSNIVHSLQALQNWSEESPVYALSQRLLEDWSVVALSLAHQEFEAGQWDSAARLAAAVPAQVELSSQAQERLTLWQKVQQQGENAHRSALAALEQQNWKAARNHAKTLASLGNDYWRQQGIQALPEQIEMAQQAQQPTADEGQLSAIAPIQQQPVPPSGAQRQSLPAVPATPGRSRFSMPVLVSLERLTVADPKPETPGFSTLA